jgi:hypothetical protein
VERVKSSPSLAQNVISPTAVLSRNLNLPPLAVHFFIMLLKSNGGGRGIFKHTGPPSVA